MICRAALLCATAAPPPRVAVAPSLIAEPSTWNGITNEWSMRDVGLFDGTVVAIAVGAGLAATTFGNKEASKDEAFGADQAVLDAERAVAESVANSPCNGPNPELLEALEAADAAAARQNPGQPPASDPFELPSVFEVPWRRKTSASKRSDSPRMSAPPEALPDIVIPSISDTDDERLWVPQTDCLSFRPLCLCVSQGYYVNLLRFVGGGTLGCHRHSSPVHAHTIKGTGYKEHSWTAKQGTYVFEPPGRRHACRRRGRDDRAFSRDGSAAVLRPREPETVTGFDDVFTKLEKARKHYEAVGLGADYVDQFVR